MDRVYQANAIETPPATTSSSGSYPTAGNKASGQLATVPGPYWFYSITEEIRNALIAAGVTPDAGKVNQLAEAMAKFLPLSGGTMKGSITLNTATLASRVVNSSYMQINGGSAWNSGASIELRGKDSETNPGMFYVRTTDGSKTKNLSLKPDGTATWDNQTILTTANGLALDGSNKMSGNLGFDESHHVFIDRTDGYMRIWGGKVDDGITGGNITLFGGEHSTGWGIGAGGLIIEANNGTVTKALKISTDGTLGWDGHSINHYLSGTGKRLTTDGTEQTVPFDGLLFIEAQRDYTGAGSLTVYINGSNIETVRSNNYSYGYAQIPVKKGDIYKGEANNLSIATADVIAYK